MIKSVKIIEIYIYMLIRIYLGERPEIYDLYKLMYARG